MSFPENEVFSGILIIDKTHQRALRSLFFGKSCKSTGVKGIGAAHNK